MRLAKVFGTGLYLFALSMGVLTLGSGCGGKPSGSDVIVPTSPEASEVEQKQRQEFMRKSQEAQRKSR